MKNILLILLFLAVPMTASASASTKFMRKFGEWEIFKKTTLDESRCIIISHPVSSAGFPGFRDKPYIGFTSVKGGKFTFSIYSGFVINKNEPIQVMIDDRIFYLKVFRDFFAYTYDDNDDIRLQKVVQSSKGPLRVRIVSSESEVANDYYDLKGLNKAFDFIKNNCN